MGASKSDTFHTYAAAALACVGLVYLGDAMADEQSDSLAEIVVTARKTQETLQSVPLSVSAVTSAEMDRRSMDSLGALGQFTPNFTFSEQAQAGRTAAVVFIRGVGQSDPLATFDPAVGIYLDGVYMGRMQALDLDMMDVERVEILRGPQGTLFGKNTDGGAVSIVTRQPDITSDALQGRVEAITGSHRRFDFLGNFDIPLVTDKLAMIVSFARRGQEGYGTRIDGEQMADKDRYIGRVALLYKATDDLQFEWSADGLTSNERQSSYKLIKVGNYYSQPVPGLGGVTYNQLLSQPYDSRWVSTNDFNYDGTGPNSARSDLWGTALTATWTTPFATIKSITAYRRNLVFNDLDPDGSPVTIVAEYETTKQHQISQEFQATGSSFSDRLKWVGGLYFFDEAVSDITDYPVLTDFGDAFSFVQDLDVHNKSYAIYGQADYSFTSKLKLTAGLRVNQDQTRVTRLKLAYPSLIPYDISTDNEPATKSHTWNSASPRLGLDYQWTPSFMTYASAAEGFKSGGFNGRAGNVSEFNQFDPEKVWTYEVGLRSDWLENRLRFNATLFYSRYTDLQLQINEAGVGASGQPVPKQVVGNIPLARVKGAELELNAVLLPGLTVDSSLGLTDARYVQLLPGAPVTLNTPFIDTPKSTVTLGAEYTRDVSDRLKVTGRVDYAYKSSISYDVSNPSGLITQAGYGLLNSKLIFDVKHTGLTVSVFGTNLTDKHYIIGGWDQCTSSSLAFCIVEYAPPREWGLSAKYQL
jgi:iron complex outermembrane recepter protein